MTFINLLLTLLLPSACVLQYTKEVGNSTSSTAGDGLAANEFRIFVTSTTYQGNLQSAGGQTTGLAGANAICATIATNAGLTRTYYAIVSDELTSAESWISVPGQIYKVDASGNKFLVADNESHLWSANTQALHSAPDLNENGEQYIGTVWTGTTDTGAISTDKHCGSWSIDLTGSIGQRGITQPTDGRWVGFNSDGIQGCAESNPIYCISQ